MYKKLALVCAKEATVSIQRDERNVFFAYVTPDPFRFTCVTQERKLKQKHKRVKIVSLLHASTYSCVVLWLVQTVTMQQSIRGGSRLLVSYV